MKIFRFVNESLERLDYIEKEKNHSVSVKDQLWILKVELKFLRTFLLCGATQHIYEGDELFDLLTRVGAVVQDAGEVILSLYVETTDGNVPMDLTRWLSYMLEKIELVKPEVNKEAYYFVMGSNYLNDAERCEQNAEFVESVLENLKNLLQCEDVVVVLLKKLVAALWKELRLGRNSFQLALKLGIEPKKLNSLLFAVRKLAEEAACHSFKCWINKMDEGESASTESAFSHLMETKLKENYTDLCESILKASKSLPSKALMTDELIMTFIDFLLENLAELLSRNDDTVVSTNDHFKSLHEELKVLRNLLMSPMQHAEHDKLMSVHIEAEVRTAGEIIFAFFIGDMDEETTRKMNTRLFRLLERCKLIKSELCLMRLLNHEATWIVPIKDQLETLYEDIQVLRTSLVNPQEEYFADESCIDLARFDGVSSAAGSAIYSFYISEIKEEMAKEMNFVLPDLVERIKHVRNGCYFIDDTLLRMDDLEKHWNCSVLVKDQIQAIKMELKFLRTFLRCAARKTFVQNHLNNHLMQTKAVVQDVGEVILTIYVETMSGKVPVDVNNQLPHILQKIELLKPAVNKDFRNIAGSGSTSNDALCGKLTLEFVDSLLENLNDLSQRESDQVNNPFGIHGRMLLFLRDYFQFSVKPRATTIIFWHLMGDVSHVAEKIAYHSYSCWINKIDENVVFNMGRDPYDHFSDRRPFIQVVTERCIDILKITKSLSSEDPMADELVVEFVVFQKSLSSEDPMTDELVVEFVGFLLENLVELLNHNGELVVSTKDSFESLHKELTFLRTFFMNFRMQYAEHEKLILKHIEAEVKAVAFIICYFYVGDMDEELTRKMEVQLFSSLQRFKLLKSELCLLELSQHEASPLVSIQDQLETFCDYIQLLRSFLLDPLKVDEKFLDLLTSIKVMASKAESAIYSIYVKGMEDDLSTEIKNALLDLVDKIKLIKADIRMIYPYAISSDFPKDGVLWLMKSVLGVLGARSFSVFQKLQMEKVKHELEFLICFLENSAEQYIKDEQLKALESRMIHATNDVKYAIDPFMLRDHPVWYCLLLLSDAMDEFQLIKKEIEKINEKTFSWMLSSQDTTSTTGEVFVGFKDEAEKVIERLIEGPAQLKVISIIGTPGIGKTTLAKKLYDNPLVAEYFYVRAWCCVSQVYHRRQLLLDILHHFVEPNDKIHTMSVEDLAELLYKRLKGQRYLIVIDDIWDIEAWHAISRCFPDDSKRSRIMFTTRNEKVALDVGEKGIPHRLRFFSDNECHELLLKKLFQKERCPAKLLEVVKQIATKCNGLPLAVVLIAGVLTRTVREEWKDVAESLNSRMSGNPESLSMEVIELSYKHLPDYLRPCFLYLGAFPEDRDIMVARLVWLWAAEGFILSTEQNRLEDIAEDYLMDLTARSLVIDAKRGYDGSVKSCRIHDLLRSFCLAKAREQNFLLLLDDHNELLDPASQPGHRYEHTTPHGIQSIESDQSSHCDSSSIIHDQQYRLCIYSTGNDFAKWKPSSSHVCSLLHFTPAFHLASKSLYDAAFIFHFFTFLRVLDLGWLLLKDLDCGIELLVHLAFLAVRIQSSSIPSSIANLKNLETFLVKGTKGEVRLPSTIWSMVKLKHLHIDSRASLVWDENEQMDALLENLETLSTPFLSYGMNTKGMIRSLPNLCKLKCIYTEFWNNFDHCNYFPVLDTLSQLESLKVLYHGRKLNRCKFSFPPNLKKLTLSKMQLPWSDIAIIASLPNLEVLKLLFRAFEGRKWETNDGEFLKLKYLKLESLDIAEWITYRDHFPLLERLVLQRCKQLKEIPSDLGDIDTLEIIEVLWCSPSAASSARQIYEEQQDMGNAVFKVVIQDLAASS